MLRELAISCYLFLVRLIFQLSSFLSLQEKTTFIMSFPGNIPMVLEEINNSPIRDRLIVIQATKQPIEYTNQSIKVLYLNRPIQFIQAIYHLATSRFIFIDNYYGLLASTPFRDGASCIQLWHAVGALKQFGLEDMSNQFRSEKALRRFQTVYDRFDKIVVGSSSMENIFKKSFGVTNDNRFLRTGIPRTDFFFDHFAKQEAVKQFNMDFPLAMDRKVILYAPTYREDQLNNPNISLALDLNEMYENFKSTHILLLRLHPAINHRFVNKYPGFIFNVTEYESINTLLLGADILITDYSSIPFEFALLDKPMIFYTYDLESYRRSRGLPNDFEANLPGPIAFNTREVIQHIKKGEFDSRQVKRFADKWNEFSNGDSTQELVKELYQLPDIQERIRENI